MSPRLMTGLRDLATDLAFYLTLPIPQRHRQSLGPLARHMSRYPRGPRLSRRPALHLAQQPRLCCGRLDDQDLGCDHARVQAHADRPPGRHHLLPARRDKDHQRQRGDTQDVGRPRRKLCEGSRDGRAGRVAGRVLGETSRVGVQQRRDDGVSTLLCLPIKSGVAES